MSKYRVIPISDGWGLQKKWGPFWCTFVEKMYDADMLILKESGTIWNKKEEVLAFIVEDRARDRRIAAIKVSGSTVIE